MTSPDTAQQRGRARREWITIGLAALGVVVALLAWQYPQWTSSEQPSSPGAAAPAAASPTSPAPATGTASPGLSQTATPGLTYLSTLGPQSGAGNLRPLPRALADQPGYQHTVVVACPSTGANDKVREVTYLLRGRYLGLSTTIRPYYPGEPDSRTYVYIVTGTRERDGTLTRRQKASQFTATMDAPARLTADVEGAEELTLQVQCESPDGMVVFTDAGLTRP